jgi:hypothetical protein
MIIQGSPVWVIGSSSCGEGTSQQYGFKLNEHGGGGSNRWPMGFFFGVLLLLLAIA